MLKKLRGKKFAKKVWIILAILIVPAFVLWESGSIVRNRQEAVTIGKISGKKISLLEYKEALDAVRNQAIIQFGDNLSEIQKYLSLESRAWERMILLAEAKKRKIRASDREVIELIQSYPFAQRKGQFDSQTYSQMLQFVFHTQPRIFEEQTRQNLTISKLYKAATDGLALTESEIKEAYRKSNEQLSLDYIAGIPSEFAKDITPPEEEIKDYFAKNSLQFKRPLSFNIEYAPLKRGSEGQKTAEEKINRDLLPRIKKGDNFLEIAKDFGLQIKETGLFGQTDPIPGIGWSPEIMNLIAKVGVGGYLPPIRVDQYYYILRLKERREPYIPGFETIKEKVKEAFVQQISREIAKNKIEACLERLKALSKASPGALDFTQVAKEYGLRPGSTALFKYGSYIEGIGASDNFWMAAQDLKEGGFSGIVEAPSGLYIIKLKSKTSVDEKIFSEEKTAFSQKLLSQRKGEYFMKFTDELKKAAQKDFND